MLAAIVAEIIRYDGRALCDFGAYWTFAVKYSHRIFFESAAARVAKLVDMGCKIFLQCLVILRAAFFAADGVYFE